MKNFFKTGMFVLLGLALTIACDDDDSTIDGDGSGNTMTIDNFDFALSSENETGNMVGVLPTSDNADSYSIDFNDPSAIDDSDIITTSGQKITYTYPEETATYEITTTAILGEITEVKTKSHTVTFESATVLADFEDEASLNLRNDTGGGATITVATHEGMDGAMSKVGVITNAAVEWEAISINNSKHVKVSGTKKVISIDFYQSEAAARNILLKLEKPMSTSEGVFDVEVPLTTENKVGWQTLEFDFSTAGNSYPNNENTTVILDQYQKIVFFVDAGSSVAGTYHIDNIEGGEFGEDVPDMDGDTVIDSIDSCPEQAANTTNGCPEAVAPTDAPASPIKDAATVISLYSDAYDDITAKWNPGWGQTTTMDDIEIAGNNVKEYKTINYSGIDITTAIDVSGKTHLTMDYWTTSATVIKIKLVDYGADGLWGEDNNEIELSFDANTGDWQTLSVPLSDYTEGGLPSTEHIGQIVLSVEGETNAFYLDNMYFY